MNKKFYKKENPVKVKEKVLRYLKEGTCQPCNFGKCMDCPIQIIINEWQK